MAPHAATGTDGVAGDPASDPASDPAGAPTSEPPGVLTLRELTDLADRLRCHADRPGSEHGDGPAALGLCGSQFRALVAELERRCHLPLLDDVLTCGSALEIVRLVNAQALSGG